MNVSSYVQPQGENLALSLIIDQNLGFVRKDKQHLKPTFDEKNNYDLVYLFTALVNRDTGAFAPYEKIDKHIERAKYNQWAAVKCVFKESCTTDWYFKYTKFTLKALAALCSTCQIVDRSVEFEKPSQLFHVSFKKLWCNQTHNIKETLGKVCENQRSILYGQRASRGLARVYSKRNLFEVGDLTIVYRTEGIFSFGILKRVDSDKKLVDINVRLSTDETVKKDRENRQNKPSEKNKKDKEQRDLTALEISQRLIKAVEIEVLQIDDSEPIKQNIHFADVGKIQLLRLDRLAGNS